MNKGIRLKELSGGEIAHRRLVDRRVLEAELTDLPSHWQLSNPNLVFDRTHLFLADLGVQQVADDLLRFVLALRNRAIGTVCLISA